MTYDTTWSAFCPPNFLNQDLLLVSHLYPFPAPMYLPLSILSGNFNMFSCQHIYFYSLLCSHPFSIISPSSLLLSSHLDILFYHVLFTDLSIKYYFGLLVPFFIFSHSIPQLFTFTSSHQIISTTFASPFLSVLLSISPAPLHPLRPFPGSPIPYHIPIQDLSPPSAPSYSHFRGSLRTSASHERF